MPRSRVQSTLAGLVDSDSEDDLGISLKSVQGARAAAAGMAASKKPRGRTTTAQNKVTKPAQTTRRTSGRLKPVGRQALAEKSGNTDFKGTEIDTSRLHGDNIAKPKGSRGRPKAATKPTTGVVELTEPEAASGGVPETEAPRRGRRPGKQQTTEEVVEILEARQADAMDLDSSDVSSTQQSSIFSDPHAPKRDGAIPRPPCEGLEPDGTDTSLRRRLGDMTRKYEVLEGRYRDLREIGVKEAEKNFDKLKKQADESTKTANELVFKLKAELAAQAALVREGQRVKEQFETSQRKVEELEARLAESADSLSDAKAEIKTLSARLAANRTAGVTNAKASGSAMNGASRGGCLGASQETAQAAQMKEDLYSDLTGLIVRNIKQDGAEDIFDCIQTGRNGTLHFKLAMAHGHTGDTYEETQVTYRPQLDAGRDGELMEILPDYLVEEITFPLHQAAKFYSRVTRSLTDG